MHGVESTLLSLEDGVEDASFSILRPGPITRDDLIQYGHVVTPERMVKSPGSLPGHYAPRKTLQIMDSDIKTLAEGVLFGLLAFTTPSEDLAGKCAAIEILSSSGDLKEAAANFYGALRRLDQSKVDIILAQPLPEEGIGVAIMDRLRRASYGSLHGTGHQASGASVQ